MNTINPQLITQQRQQSVSPLPPSNILSPVSKQQNVHRKLSLIRLAPITSTTDDDSKSELENPDPTGQELKLLYVDQLQRKVVAISKNNHSIPLNLVIKNGIHCFSGKFDKSSIQDHAYRIIGIVKADFRLSFPCAPGAEINMQSMLYYNGGSGGVHFKGNKLEGNEKFVDGQLITMELNANAGTLHFFIDSVQQPIFVKGIKEPVKFYIYLNIPDSSFTVLASSKLKEPTVKKLANEKAIDW
ncbi:MAG: hypothetical protein EZS28_002170 [Streblomastix strix]|uniref:SPRY domain-containing protein n=1 Tax=Streblomastix strix TaxID=222440 RepID=A0A5J4X664_9EUKA|nr:MAG: hypothetical protein EZS28_002170 [Streblomastix strix]